MTTTLMPYCAAVASSWELKRKPPSPDTATTALSGRATFGEITDATLATLRAECPGWDYQTLHADFRTWIEADAGRTPVSYQNAFIGYVRRFDAKNRHTLR